MKSNTPRAIAQVDPAELIPLSHLQLDLEPPAVGWTVHLEGRGVAVVADDLGRLAVTRTDARRLFVEQRESEALKVQKVAELELQAVERDRQWRAQLGRGIPQSALNGMTYAEAAQSTEADFQGYRPRSSVVADALDNSGLTFHSIGPTEG